MYFISGKYKKSILEVYFKYTEILQGCASNQIEDESHFLIYCNKYSILRSKFYKK